MSEPSSVKYHCVCLYLGLAESLALLQDGKKQTGFDQSRLQKMLGSPAPRSRTHATRRKTSDKGEPKKKTTDAKPKRKVIACMPGKHITCLATESFLSDLPKPCAGSHTLTSPSVLICQGEGRHCSKCKRHTIRQ